MSGPHILKIGATLIVVCCLAGMWASGLGIPERWAIAALVAAPIAAALLLIIWGTV